MEKVIRRLERRIACYERKIQQYKELVEDDKKRMAKAIDREQFKTVQVISESIKSYKEKITAYDDIIEELSEVLEIAKGE